MELNPPSKVEPAPDSARVLLQRLLCSPWLDRVLAVGLVATQTKKVYSILFHDGFQIQYLGLILNFVVYAFYALTRRLPVRVTPNPLYWLISLASNWSGVVLTLYQPADHQVLAPQWVVTAVSVVATVLVLVTRISLGRSFGIVPALRSVVTRGAYQVVRHPVYAGSAFSMIPVLLTRFSPGMCALVAVAIGLMVVRAELEESFLAAEESYRSYRSAVRWKMLPGVY